MDKAWHVKIASWITWDNEETGMPVKRWFIFEESVVEWVAEAALSPQQ
jgi:hypothetical protein